MYCNTSFVKFLRPLQAHVYMHGHENAITALTDIGAKDPFINVYKYSVYHYE